MVVSKSSPGPLKICTDWTYYGSVAQEGDSDGPEIFYNEICLGFLPPFLCSNLKGFIGRQSGLFDLAP